MDSSGDVSRKVGDDVIYEDNKESGENTPLCGTPYLTLIVWFKLLSSFTQAILDPAEHPSSHLCCRQLQGEAFFLRFIECLW